MINRAKNSMAIIIISHLLILGCFTSIPAFAAPVPDSFSGIVNENTKSVVNISTTQVIKQKAPKFFPFFPDFPFSQDSPDFEGREREFRRKSLGSGFIIDSDGYIITNNHVVENADDITVTLWDESEYKAKVKGRDPKTDIALIRVDADKPLPAVTLGDSAKLDVGDWVIAMGNPYGLGHTVTAGIVSAKSRFIGSGPYDDFIQTDAAINPGNSGGPLFNTKGEVVGINTAIIPMAQGIGFAIPVNLSKEIMRSLKTKGYVERGWLGVTVQKITPELAENLKLTSRQGALVTDVLKNSPADKAKIKRKDVIVEFAGEKVSEHSLPRLVAAMPSGKQVTVKAIRDGKPIELTVTISRQEEGIPEALIAEKLGLKTKTINPEIAPQFGIMDGGGVLITEVAQGATKAGEDILVKDIIVEAGGSRINSTEEFAIIIKGLKSGERILTLLKRGSSYLYRSLRVRE
ncbi:MAG: Do family serine endopeptidase [Nitrospiraceae bacterium]|nr:MAG: Do family serine endopeptidase [Nitrospiraceae bacterium]